MTSTNSPARLSDRLYLLERELNVRDTRPVVAQALAAIGDDLPEPAQARVRAQFTEATCGFGQYNTFADRAALQKAVADAAGREKAYIASVSGEVSTAHARDIGAARQRWLDDMMGIRPNGEAAAAATQPTGGGVVPATPIDARQQQLHRIMGIRD